MAFFKGRRRRRSEWLLVVLAVETVLVVTYFLSTPTGPHLGFLVKNGGSYILAWRQAPHEYQTQSYTTLEQALNFAREELGLTAGRVPTLDHELEHIWLSTRAGQSVLFWKPLRTSILSKLTFENPAEATFFYQAFRNGGYSPSLFGHSILLTPVATP